MATEQTGWKRKIGAAVLIAGGFAALNAWWVPSLILLPAGLVFMWPITAWWRLLVYGALGGLFAGALVLAPGFRLSMRVVALLDPRRTPDLTLDGTLFILIAIGGLAGLAFGVLGAVGRFGWSLSARTAWLAPAGLVMLFLLLDDELRGELFELGAGPWVNIPMFSVVAAAYGWVVMRVVSRLDSRRRTRRRTPVLSEISGSGSVG